MSNGLYRAHRRALIGGAGLAAALCLAPPIFAQPAIDGPAVCAVTGDPAVPLLDAATRGRLEATLRDMVDRGIAPGVVMMIEQNGQPVFSFAHGMADAEHERAMADDTLFRLYSMTKPITSLVALQLVAEGRLSLDDPVSRYIPEFADATVLADEGGPDAAPVSLERPVTIRDLLRHSAGLTYRTAEDNRAGPIYAARGIPAGPGLDQPPTDGSAPVQSLAELVRRVADVPLLNQPGTDFTYGNATEVLGRVVEIVTGERLSQAFSARIFGPLGMSSTFFQVPADDADRMSSAYVATAQFPDRTPGVMGSVPIEELGAAALRLIDDAETSFFLPAPRIEYGGAGLVGTAGDYLRFTRAVRENRRPDGAMLLPPALADAMRSNQLPPEALSDDPTLRGLGFGYGFAVKLGPTEAEPVFPQCGYFWGGAASTSFWIDPAGETSGVVMTQIFGGDVTSYQIELLRILYGETP
ncbi:MAG: serine hydrolase domain-containing protein [Pseudomonadota bacterium]